MELYKITSRICPKCGGELVQKTETGYISGRALGRPAGAKGCDTWSDWVECKKCGEKLGEFPRVVEPCHVCGSEENLTCYNMCEISEFATGFYEWVPGIDNYVNLCSDPACFRALVKKVKKIMRNPWFE